jgi:hypothetical protein
VAKYRYLGTETVELRLNGHPKGGAWGPVEPEQLIEVDDDVARAHAWAESTWDEVEAPPELDDEPDNNDAPAWSAPVTDDEE